MNWICTLSAIAAGSTQFEGYRENRRSLSELLIDQVTTLDPHPAGPMNDPGYNPRHPTKVESSLIETFDLPITTFSTTGCTNRAGQPCYARLRWRRGPRRLQFGF